MLLQTNHPITTSTSVVYFYFSYPDRDQLQAIYSAYLRPVLNLTLSSHPVWGSVKNVHALAGSMVAVYEQVRQAGKLWKSVFSVLNSRQVMKVYARAKKEKLRRYDCKLDWQKYKVLPAKFCTKLTERVISSLVYRLLS